MTHAAPYCGSAPLPGELLSRFNVDPILLLVLMLVCVWHVASLNGNPRIDPRQFRSYAIVGWLLAAAAFVSPLCALSVSLFSARVAQHMVLVLIAAPLIARGLPRRQALTESPCLWMSAAAFLAALWFWHMPVPYEAAFTSKRVYWAMHVTLFGSSILLWRELINHSRQQAGQALAAGMLTFVQMGLLGAVLALADKPMFQWYLLTTEAWGLTPLQDQQLGGAIMSVPGTALFLGGALRSISRLGMIVSPP